jgi:hypothetical protein
VSTKQGCPWSLEPNKTVVQASDLLGDVSLDSNIIAINYTPISINDNLPIKEEIRYAVRRLRRWKASRPSGIRAEHLKDWQQDKMNTKNQHNMVKLIQHVFGLGKLLQDSVTLILFPKTDGGYRGIGILKTIWKIISSIIKERCNNTIVFSNSFRGFQSERGTSMSIIEAKLHLETLQSTKPCINSFLICLKLLIL